MIEKSLNYFFYTPFPMSLCYMQSDGKWNEMVFSTLRFSNGVKYVPPGRLCLLKMCIFVILLFYHRQLSDLTVSRWSCLMSVDQINFWSIRNRTVTIKRWLLLKPDLLWSYWNIKYILHKKRNISFYIFIYTRWKNTHAETLQLQRTE